MHMQPKPRTFAQYARSLLFSLCMISVVIVYAPCCLVISLLPFEKRSALTRKWIKFVMDLCGKICGLKYRVEGLEHYPTMPVGIIMAKHQTAWETFYLAVNTYQVTIIAKRELTWVPFFGWGLKMLDPIVINRENRRSAMEQVITKGKACLDAGRSIVMFPEGTRVPAGEVGKYRQGGARLAVATNYPIIPVAHNAGRLWPKRQFYKVPGTITLVYGPPIYPEGKTPEQLIAEVKTWIETTMQRIDTPAVFD